MIALILALFCFAPTSAGAESLSDGIRQVVDSLDLTTLSEFADDMQLLSARSSLADTVRAIASGEITLSFDAVLELLSGGFMAAVKQSFWRVTRLIVPIMLTGFSAHLSEGTTRMAKSACCLSVCVFLAQDLSEHALLCRDSVTRMADVMQGLFPILLTLMTAVGTAGSSALMQPAVVASAGLVTGLISRVTLPLAIASAMLMMLTRLGTGIRLRHLASLAQQASAWTLGVCFTVFIAVLMTRGMTAAAIDGVTIRTAKYAINRFIPVVGGLFADTVDTLVGSSLMVQSALGVTGMLLLSGYALGPMLRTLAVTLIYRLTAALLQPVGDQDITECIHDFGGILMLFFIVQLCVGAMFLLLIAQLVAVSSSTVMLR